MKQSKNNIVLKPKKKKYSFDDNKYIAEKNKEKKSQSNNNLTSLSYFNNEKQSEVSFVNLDSIKKFLIALQALKYILKIF